MSDYSASGHVCQHNHALFLRYTPPLALPHTAVIIAVRPAGAVRPLAAMTIDLRGAIPLICRFGPESERSGALFPGVKSMLPRRDADARRRQTLVPGSYGGNATLQSSHGGGIASSLRSHGCAFACRKRFAIGACVGTPFVEWRKNVIIRSTCARVDLADRCPPTPAAEAVDFGHDATEPSQGARSIGTERTLTPHDG